MKVRRTMYLIPRTKNDDLPETVTYHNDTVRPAYLIVYGDKPKRVTNLKAFVLTMFKTPIVS